MNKKILLISPFFYPEPISTGKFNTETVIALRDLGHNVTVFCYHPFYPSWLTKKSNDLLDNIKIIRGGKNQVYTNIPLIRRFVLEVGFAFFIIRKMIFRKNDFDIIIPVFPPSLAFIFALLLVPKRVKKVGLIHDLQEVYSRKKRGVINYFLNKLIHNVEKKVYSSCNSLIFLSKEMLLTAKKMYGLENKKLTVQYPFYTINLQNNTNALDYIFNNQKENIVYSGALSEKQNPIGLLNLFDHCSKNIVNTVYHIFSEGKEYESLKEANKNPKILFHRLVDKNNIEELYKKSALQIIPQLKGTAKGSLPSKLPNILVSGCKVLCITDKDSDIVKLFQDNNFSDYATTWDKKILKNKIEILLNKKINLGLQSEKAKKLFAVNSMINAILEE